MPETTTKKPRVTKAASAPKAPRAKKAPVAPTAPKIVAPSASAEKRTDKYLYTVGGRKSARAIIRFYEAGTGKRTVNGREFSNYFATQELLNVAESALVFAGKIDNVDIVAKAHGGGSRGQADAMRLAIARAILMSNEATRPGLRGNGFLTRDSRKKERKKYGLKKARRAPQWGKR